MMEKLLQQERELERTKIINETAKIPWLDLQRFFASGKVIWADSDLDLVEVALAIQGDDVQRVDAWTKLDKIAAVTDDQARLWIADDSLLWAVAIKPWVLVQELAADSS
jgi:hypothetical protein